VVATLAESWPTFLIALAILALVVGADYAVFRAVRRLERLVQVLAAMAMTVVTAIGLSFVLVLTALAVIVTLCPPDAFECPA
jgi:hypothetical protein